MEVFFLLPCCCLRARSPRRQWWRQPREDVRAIGILAVHVCPEPGRHIPPWHLGRYLRSPAPYRGRRGSSRQELVVQTIREVNDLNWWPGESCMEAHKKAPRRLRAWGKGNKLDRLSVLSINVPCPRPGSIQPLPLRP